MRTIRENLAYQFGQKSNQYCFLLIAILLLYAGGCNSTKRDLEKAKSEGTISAYEAFLKTHPEKSLSDEVRIGVETLYFQQARSLDSVVAYANYLGRYSKGKFADEARSRIYEILEKERLPTLRHVKKMRLVIHESCGPPGRLRFSIYKATKEVLENAGFSIVEEEAKEFDATFEIEAEAEPLGADYSAISDKMFSSTLYTGASAWGKISITLPSGSAYNKSFKGITRPPDQVSAPRPGDPISAPLGATCRRSISAKLLEVVLEICGPNSLILTLKKDPYEWNQALVDIGEMAIEPLITCLKDYNVDVKWVAIGTLGFIKSSRSVELLIEVLKDNDAEVKDYGMKKLSELLSSMQRDSRLTKILVATLKDNNPKARALAAEQLGKSKDPSSIEPLIAALKDSNPGVRFEAVCALSFVKDTRLIEPLMTCLKDPEDKIRVRAANNLREITGWNYTGEHYGTWMGWWKKQKEENKTKK